jgi:hypothetical protein
VIAWLASGLLAMNNGASCRLPPHATLLVGVTTLMIGQSSS